MTAPRPQRFTVLRDSAPFRAPTDADVLGVVVAADRQQARRAAERLFPATATVVVRAAAWPVDDGRDR